ncbi:MAG: hypothetical protein U0836_18035 [Pirellulales bacterium]
MSIERTILEAWGTHRPLAAVAPLERVFAGPVPPPPADGQPTTVPYIALERLADVAQLRTSSRRGLSVEALRMRVVAATLEAALEIAELARRRFTAFGGDMTAGVIQDMRVVGQQHAPLEQGLWEATLEWQVRVSRDPA